MLTIIVGCILTLNRLSCCYLLILLLVYKKTACQKVILFLSLQFVWVPSPPCEPQSENAVPSLPIKLQSPSEDVLRHQITSNILFHTQACLCQPQISLQIKTLKMGEFELPDNNRITSCRFLDASIQLGSNFLLSLCVCRQSSCVFPV